MHIPPRIRPGHANGRTTRRGGRGPTGGAARTVDRRTCRLTAGMVALAAAAALIGSTFLAWVTTAMVSGGTTAISGWGTIRGGSRLVDGVNINTLMAGMGDGTFRPGLPVVIAGAVAVLPAVVLAATGPGIRAHRTVGVILALCGLAALIQGLYRAIDPGNALGVLPGKDASLGAGPVIAAVAGAAICAVSLAVLTGALDPARRVGRQES